MVPHRNPGEFLDCDNDVIGLRTSGFVTHANESLDACAWGVIFIWRRFGCQDGGPVSQPCDVRSTYWSARKDLIVDESGTVRWSSETVYRPFGRLNLRTFSVAYT
jgi:hypothetical protein